MSRRTHVVIALLILGGVFTTLFWLDCANPLKRRTRNEAAAKRLAAYCTNVRTNLRVDAAHLEDTSNPTRQERAAERFFIAAQHSRSEVQLCLGEIPPEVDAQYGACFVGGPETSDYVCLRRLARIIDTAMGKEPTK